MLLLVFICTILIYFVCALHANDEHHEIDHTMEVSFIEDPLDSIDIDITGQMERLQAEQQAFQEAFRLRESMKDLDRQRREEIEGCLKEKIMPKREGERSNQLRILYNNSNPMIMLHNVIDAFDAAQLYALARCVQELLPFNFENSLFYTGNEEDAYGGGNTVTYLTGFTHAINDVIQHILENINRATSATGWDATYTPASTLNLRTMEKIEYFNGGELLQHADTESVYTFILMLSNPEDYTGGEFFIDNSSANPVERVVFNPPQYSGLLIDSLAKHGVDKIHSGHRVIFALELWTDCASSSFDRRPVKGEFVCIHD